MSPSRAQAPQSRRRGASGKPVGRPARSSRSNRSVATQRNNSQRARIQGVPAYSSIERIVDDEMRSGYTAGPHRDDADGPHAGARGVVGAILVSISALCILMFVVWVLSHGSRAAVAAVVILILIAVVVVLVMSNTVRARRRVRQRVVHEIARAYNGGSFDAADIESKKARIGLVGAMGELHVADALERLPRRFTVLHDVGIFRGEEMVANIDHLVLRDKMIAVIETKFWGNPALAVPSGADGEPSDNPLATSSDVRLEAAAREIMSAVADLSNHGAGGAGGAVGATVGVIAVYGRAAVNIPIGGMVLDDSDGICSVPLVLARADSVDTVLKNVEGMPELYEAGLSPRARIAQTYRQVVRNSGNRVRLSTRA